MGQITVQEGRSYEDAQDLKAIVTRARADAEDLLEKVKKIVNSDLSLDWADEELENWKKFAETDMEQVFASVTSGAQSLESAIEEALKYSKG